MFELLGRLAKDKNKERIRFTEGRFTTKSVTNCYCLEKQVEKKQFTKFVNCLNSSNLNLAGAAGLEPATNGLETAAEISVIQYIYEIYELISDFHSSVFVFCKSLLMNIRDFHRSSKICYFSGVVTFQM